MKNARDSADFFPFFPLTDGEKAAIITLFQAEAARFSPM